jgi:inactivated superfamily I helicase
VIVRAAAQGPVVLPLVFGDWHIVNAGDSALHQAIGIELPVLVAITTKPIEAVIMPLIGEAHCDAVLTKGPNLFDQPIAELAVLFAREERDDGLTAL